MVLPRCCGDAAHQLSLDGQWTLTLDEDDAATKRMAAAGNKTSGPITVPGAWQAQGFGEETERAWHQYMGVSLVGRPSDGNGLFYVGGSVVLDHH